MTKFKFLPTCAAVIGVFALVLFAGLGAIAWDTGGTPASDALLAAATLCTAVPKFLFTTREAKAAIGCGTTRLYQLINDGTLDARRLGARTYITAASIEALVASLKPVITPTLAKTEHERWSGHHRPRPRPREDEPEIA